MIHHLRAGGVSLVVDAPGTQVPSVLHWGADLGPLPADALDALAGAVLPAVPPSSIDVPLRLSLVPTLAEGWSGQPGLAVHRAAGPLDVALATTAVEVRDDDGDQVLDVRTADPAAAVAVRTEVRLAPEGVLTVRHTLANTGDGPLHVQTLDVVLPVPDRARELADHTGLWSHERRQQRLLPGHGVWLREGRHGRPGHDDAYLLVAGTPGFGTRTGEVWSVHCAWSGDRRLWSERSPLGPSALGGGELWAPGETTLAPGEDLTTPWLVATWSGDGLDGLSDRLHARHRRRRGPLRPRPLVLNTWEAVYFDHDLPTLSRLVDVAARVGVERFVLDDGWFRGRRDDRTSLGDWTVDPDVWPDGLHPLAQRVTAAGMELGLWVEPEMVSADSDLARAHPDWVLGRPAALEWRHQRVLDLAHPGAWAHVHDALVALLEEYPVRFLKWDHNRDLLAPGAHAQTAALYRMLDALRARFPDVEIESCASGGGRVDLGVAERVDRFWASDTNDPLERQEIHRWSTLLLPPEHLGAHLGDARAHTTGRTSDLGFRLATSLFGHAGIEGDLTRSEPAELAAVTVWAQAYRRLRGLLHTGTVVRAEVPDPALAVHGVVAADRSEAVVALVALAAPQAALPAPARVPGLDPARSYRVTHVDLGAGAPLTVGDAPPAWWADVLAGRDVVLPGRVLEQTGLARPLLAPQQAAVLHLTALDA
ncbi:alpha-galactosidase [Cellulomonas oligotrophica]|uniref:alpha-galactosidase n=1 Tax=Cellulomonas oligotrophica TaxID=931536 RepID=A0A7Y9FE63_9CELL|nr:alpha-galactosidase [Cellulomonas oligotrophica]NYD85317.1 alpha-galactosidase [Cellulomonas oligotrophica]GIG33248.1 alpha-galactosidase [Cellulomonas oligotrophica]